MTDFEALQRLAAAAPSFRPDWDDSDRCPRPSRRNPCPPLRPPRQPDQPLRLTDLHPTADGLTLRLGPDPLFVPAPLTTLIHQLADTRRHLNGAGHPDNEWLFPGRRAGQPIEPDQLAERLNRHGITRAARTAALNALLTDVPAPVLAKLLDREPWRVTTRAKTLGTDWAHYASVRTKP